MEMNQKHYLLVFLFSLLLEVCLSPLRGVKIYYATLAEGICFFLLTYHFLSIQYSQPKKIFWLVLLGGIGIQLPSRVFWFTNTLSSIGSPISIIIGVVLAYVYYKNRNKNILIFCIILWFALMTIGQYLFLYHVVYPSLLERHPNVILN